MTNISTYRGDDLHRVTCTGDCVVGDRVKFERATFSGGFRNAKFAGFEIVSGEIIRDSYGAERQQHTFTIMLENGDTMKIKGRNLYAEGTWRQAWSDETLRRSVLDEKHTRGGVARATRARRLA